MGNAGNRCAMAGCAMSRLGRTRWSLGGVGVACCALALEVSAGKVGDMPWRQSELASGRQVAEEMAPEVPAPVAAESWLDGLADPTRPAAWQERKVKSVTASRPDVRVDSIIVSAGRKMARINGTLLSEGQDVGPIRLVKVERSRVRLQWRGEEWEQDLGQSQSPPVRR